MPAHFFASFEPPSAAEWMEAFPVILSLIIIEGLLSVDNALAIAAMASHLPEKQKQQALRWGIIGAYGFRGLAMAFAAEIAGSIWLKICGASYLIYLMCEHFTSSDPNHKEASDKSEHPRGFLATIVAIEFMDLSLSVDNVVAAVAMSPKLWVVCTGVFIAILALRFVAGACIRLIEVFPILEHAAFLLIGYVGFILAFELLGSAQGGFGLIPFNTEVGSLEKFAGVVILLGISVSYSRTPAMQRALKPAITLARPPMHLMTAIVGALFAFALWPVRVVTRSLRG